MHIIYYESFTVIWALILMANSNYVAPILKVRDTVGFQNIVVLHELQFHIVICNVTKIYILNYYQEPDIIFECFKEGHFVQ